MSISTQPLRRYQHSPYVDNPHHYADVNNIATFIFIIIVKNTIIIKILKLF
jgi:hypothetical protein